MDEQECAGEVTCECGAVVYRPKKEHAIGYELYRRIGSGSVSIGLLPALCHECLTELRWRDHTVVARSLVTASESAEAVAFGEVSMSRAAVEWLEEAVASDPSLHEELRDHLADLSHSYACSLDEEEDDPDGD